MFVVWTAAWLIAIVYATIPSYWLLVHPRARQWAKQGGRPLRGVGPAWLLLWVVTGAITCRWRFVVAYHPRWTWVAAGLLIAAGLVIYSFAREEFSTDQILGRPELEPHKHEQALRTAGIRRHIRHPYYLGHLLELVGWTLGSGLVVLYGLTLFAMISGYFMVCTEERELQERFGCEYREYQQHTAAMIPGVW